MPRPPKPPAERKSETFRFRLSAAEQSAIERAADIQGVKPTAWARGVLLETSVAALRGMTLEGVAPEAPLTSGKPLIEVFAQEDGETDDARKVAEELLRALEKSNEGQD